eukprot:c21580_g1_i1 orf=133-396(+)
MSMKSSSYHVISLRSNLGDPELWLLQTLTPLRNWGATETRQAIAVLRPATGFIHSNPQIFCSYLTHISTKIHVIPHRHTPPVDRSET